MTNHHDTNRLAGLIDTKHSVLGGLRELAVRQLAVAGEGGGALVSLLAVKQKLLDELLEIEKQLDPFRREDPDERQWTTPEHRARCAETAAACRELLDEIVRLEQQGMEQLRSQQQSTRNEIHRAHDSATARAAYLASSPQAPRHFDLTSES